MQKYERFLDELNKTDWKVVGLTEFKSLPINDKVLAIKHTVTDIEKAKEMALLEQQKEIYSTYFLSDSQPYFQDWKTHSNYIYLLGHELGIQPNFLGAVTSNGLNIHKYLMQIQMGFAQFGIIINGYTSLETDISKQMKIKDYNYFYDYADKEQLIEIKRPMSESSFISMGIHPLIEYGLLYFVEKLERKNTYDLKNYITSFNFLDRAKGKTIIEV